MLVSPHSPKSQSPDEDSLSSDPIFSPPHTPPHSPHTSQSPDEDSLSSDLDGEPPNPVNGDGASLNPLTRIHCLPTYLWCRRYASCCGSYCLNPLTRIHCLPTTLKEATASTTTICLNPLTRIHCLPTVIGRLTFAARRCKLCLNPLTRIHCLPTQPCGVSG